MTDLTSPRADLMIDRFQLEVVYATDQLVF